MEIGTPFIIDNPDGEFENHIDRNSAKTGTDTGNKFSDDSLPFEFSRTRMWNENFYSPEIGNGHSIAALDKELKDIKMLISDIKNILTDIFEIDS
ncbi:MAG: hypothetical protein E7488_07870 [Ruminococcaceae bacterium]|nr:hypothetical protein [Oscillospiraceae bacterium]